MTGHGVVPEPSSITIFNPSYPGWWDTPEKHALLDAFTTESDPAKRVPLWHKLQAQFYVDVPTVKVVTNASKGRNCRAMKGIDERLLTRSSGARRDFGDRGAASATTACGVARPCSTVTVMRAPEAQGGETNHPTAQ